MVRLAWVKACLLLVCVLMFLPAQVEAKSCEELSEIACLESSECLLSQTGEKGAYVCRAPDHVCEEKWDKAKRDKLSCVATRGCFYRGDECYCKPRLHCFCGGGRPASCEPIH